MNAYTEAKTYFQRIKDMKLNNPTMIGFGISDKQSFDTASQVTRGAIVGSAFCIYWASPTKWSESQNSSIQYVVEIFVVLPRMFLFMHQL